MTLIRAIQTGDWAAALSWIMALAVGITVHEFAHAKFADLAGDPTPRSRGRVTLNPLAHYDPIGSTMILLFGMGWGKPVPTNPMLYRHPRRDEVRVSLGGIGANIVVAFLFGMTLRLGIVPEAYEILAGHIVLLNLLLAFFNILPLYPLDGSHALVSLLPREAARKVSEFYERYALGPLVAFVLALNFIPALGLVIWLPVGVLMWLFAGQGLTF
ncbi:MAG: site-2 protease family protein [candidate division WS1 bacterium]|jgi:Zn-dependent protease|nr:site-2 protease family protein [candidate division WS1 bacterium]